MIWSICDEDSRMGYVCLMNLYPAFPDETSPEGSLQIHKTHTENQGQVSVCPSAPQEVSILPELTLGHLCYCLTGGQKDCETPLSPSVLFDVPIKPNGVALDSFN